jgi:hypothetical protein
MYGKYQNKDPPKVKWNINSIMIKVPSKDFIEHKNLCWFFVFIFLWYSMGVMGKTKKILWDVSKKQKHTCHKKHLVFFNCHVNNPKETLVKKK